MLTFMHDPSLIITTNEAFLKASAMDVSVPYLGDTCRKSKNILEITYQYNGGGLCNVLQL